MAELLPLKVYPFTLKGLVVLPARMVKKLMTNRIYHRSPIQTEKSQPESKWIMPETRFTEFRALSIDRRVGISRSASETIV